MGKGTLGQLAAWATVVILAVSGCVGSNEGVPVIVNDSVLVARTPDRPRRYESPQRYRSTDVKGQWVPPAPLERKWTAIVIHHSATGTGCAASFDKWHREYMQWDGVGYHFVIGNGTESGDGQIEPTFRWWQQRTGAHCKTPNNWANEEGIGICLVGDFNQSSPTWRQTQSLAKLVQFLTGRYRVAPSRIYGHKDTPGARVTECPGRNFSMMELKSQIRSWAAAN